MLSRLPNCRNCAFEYRYICSLAGMKNADGRLFSTVCLSGRRDCRQRYDIVDVARGGGDGCLHGSKALLQLVLFVCAVCAANDLNESSWFAPAIVYVTDNRCTKGRAFVTFCSHFRLSTPPCVNVERHAVFVCICFFLVSSVANDSLSASTDRTRAYFHAQGTSRGPSDRDLKGRW